MKLKVTILFSKAIKSLRSAALLAKNYTSSRRFQGVLNLEMSSWIFFHIPGENFGLAVILNIFSSLWKERLNLFLNAFDP